MSFKQELIKKFNRSIFENAKMSNYSWFNLGGPAEYLFKPENDEQLIEFLEENKKNKLDITILGAGSNTLIRDQGIKGVVIKLGSEFSKINLIDKDIIKAGAAALDKRISQFALDKGIGNLEFLSCIPGSIGGAVVMNSGCYNNDISKVLISIEVIDIIECRKKEIQSENIKFFYRGNNLSNNFIITSVKLRRKLKSKKIVEEFQNKLINKKKLSQPSRIKTCGSTFKNLENNKKAWELIKETGCDEFKEGDAIISQKHCNFFVNNGNANSADIERLINKVKQTVYKKTGINLELEIKIIGD